MRVSPTFLLVLGVFCCSTAVMFIKLTTLDPLWLSAARLWIASACLLPAAVRAYARTGRGVGESVRTAWVPSLLLAAHFISWIHGARQTPAANATLIVNLAPVAMPMVMFLMLGERVRRRELAGTGLGLAGVVLICWGDLGSGHLKGDLICTGSMVFLTVYLAYSRRLRAAGPILTYLVPLYGLAALWCTGITLALGRPFQITGPREWLYILALGVLPTIVGHGLLNHAMRVFRGQVVSVANLGQCLFASGMAWGLFREVPGVGFYPAAVLISVGIVLTLWPGRAVRARRPGPESG